MISLGDLIVFVAVLVIVAAFLKVVHTFVSASGPGPESSATHPAQQSEKHAEAARMRNAEKITESQSVST